MEGVSTTPSEPFDPAEAEYRLLYSVVVAGKSAKFARAAMQRFFADAGETWPFAWIRELDAAGKLDEHMRKSRMGCYERLVKSFREIANAKPDLMRATPEELEMLHGIGPKTARFAIMWVRPKERFAALDTHVLKWLRFLGHKASKSTPSGAEYARLERIMLDEADRRGMAPRMLDAMIWEHASGYSGAGDPAVWPAWLQKEPAAAPAEIVEYFKSYAA